VRDLTIAQFLDRLADRVPAPGGGASAALHAAQAASLLAMVARYSEGPKYATQAEMIDHVLRRADELRAAALGWAEQDAAAFGVVAAAYAMPRATQPERSARQEAIATALLVATEPPVQVISAADEIVALAERLAPAANQNVITDVGAAADAARAAATTARLNVEVNLRGLTEEAVRQRLRDAVAGVDEIVSRANQVVAWVRKAVQS
jgi:methenyltetrahydrofolate cyclohydrolase